MSEINNINVSERSEEGDNKVSGETLYMPEEYVKNNVAIDMDSRLGKAEDETKDETSFEPFENEQAYKSPESVSPEAKERIRAFELYRNVGSKVLRMYGKAA